MVRPWRGCFLTQNGNTTGWKYIKNMVATGPYLPNEGVIFRYYLSHVKGRRVVVLIAEGLFFYQRTEYGQNTDRIRKESGHNNGHFYCQNLS